MKHLLSILIAAILCATASAQTIKSLGFNTTNGEVVANTGTNVLTFTNDVKFGADTTISGQVIAGSGVSFSFEDADFAYGATLVRQNLGFSTNLDTLWTATNASNARSAMGLPLAALTNTSNVTMVRALAGSTNTNHPFSGTVDIIDGNMDSHNVTISNGIIVNWQAP